MSGVRKLEIKTQLLMELRRTSGIPQSGRGLLNLLRIVMTPIPLESEMNQALGELEGARFVIAIRDSLEPEIVKWSITDTGLAKIAEMEAR